MKKFLTSLFTVLLIIGIAGGVSSYKAAMVAFSGETINLNEAVKTDFNEPAKVEGEIYYVYDIIAVEEVTRTTYGIKTGSDETNFYLIETYSKEQYEEAMTGSELTYEPLTLIYSTGNDETIAKLDKMVEDWYAYEEELNSIYESALTEKDLEAIYDVPFPEETIEISGMITEYEDMDKLNGYRDEYIGLLGYEGDALNSYINDYCVDMIIDNTNVAAAKNVFLVAVAVAIVGLIGLIVSLISSKKKQTTEEFY